MSNESFSDQRSTDENTLRARSSSFISICLLLFLSPSSFAASKRQNTKTRCASAPRFRDRGIRKLAAWRDFPPRAILPSPYHSTSPSPPLPLSPRPPSAFRPGTGSTAALFRRRARSSPSPSPSPPPPPPRPAFPLRREGDAIASGIPRAAERHNGHNLSAKPDRPPESGRRSSGERRSDVATRTPKRESR